MHAALPRHCSAKPGVLPFSSYELGCAFVLQGGNATAGHVIAVSGLSGAVDSPLTHFIYLLDGKIYKSATAVDPVPCFAP